VHQGEVDGVGFLEVREAHGGVGGGLRLVVDVDGEVGDVPILRVDEGIAVECGHLLALGRGRVVGDHQRGEVGREIESDLGGRVDHHARAALALGRAVIMRIDRVEEGLRRCLAGRGGKCGECGERNQDADDVFHSVPPSARFAGTSPVNGGGKLWRRSPTPPGNRYAIWTLPQGEDDFYTCCPPLMWSSAPVT